MLTLSDKIHIRANTLWTIFLFLKPSFWVFVTMVISFYKFANYGLGMYAERFPASMSLPEYLQIFAERSVTPMFWWWLGAILAETFFIRPLYYKYVVCRLAT